jgi:dihydrofolate reductase
MSRVCVRCFGVSLDGFAAGPDQSLENPLGVRGFDLMRWVLPTQYWRTHQKQEGQGETGVDHRMMERGMAGLGAWILGRNMFGPVRGPWPDESWRGWWGEEPPYHVPVFVLTHHARKPLEMAGGTTFHFVTDGIESALRQARAAAGDLDIRIGGGANTVRQYLKAGAIDELHLALGAVLMGQGEPLFRDLDLSALGYTVAETIPGERATHLVLKR